MGLVDCQSASVERGKVIIRCTQRTRRRGNGVRPGVHGRGGCTAERGRTTHHTAGLTIHKPGHTGREGSKDEAIIGLALGIGRHRQVGLVDGQRTRVERGKVIIRCTQRPRRRGNGVRPGVHGRGGCTAERGRTTHHTAGLTIHKPGHTGREGSKDLTIIGLALGIGRHRQVGFTHGQCASVVRHCIVIRVEAAAGRTRGNGIRTDRGRGCRSRT